MANHGGASCLGRRERAGGKYACLRPDRSFDTIRPHPDREEVRHVQREPLDLLRPSTFAVGQRVDLNINAPVTERERAKVLQTLDGIGYDGYATIEQDRVHGAGCPPLDDLLASMKLLRDIRGF